MSTIHKISKANDALPAIDTLSLQVTEVAFVKGAPVEVLQLCSNILIQGKPCALTPEFRQEIIEALDEFTGRALRVLALAKRDLPVRDGAYSAENVETAT